MRRKIICLFLLCLFCIPGVAWAQETSDEITNQNLQGQIEASGAQELSEQAPDEAKEMCIRDRDWAMGVISDSSTRTPAGVIHVAG